MLLLGWRGWPGVWVGALLANYTIQYSAPLAAAIATGNTMEAVAAVMLVRRFVGSTRRFERGEDVIGFVAGAMASCAVAASVGAVALGVGGYIAVPQYFPTWWTWWLGDFAGIIVVTPLLLAWSRRWDIDWSVDRVVECVALAVLLAGVTLLVFGDWLIASDWSTRLTRRPE